jgi:hypothetical protein
VSGQGCGHPGDGVQPHKLFDLRSVRWPISAPSRIRRIRRRWRVALKIARFISGWPLGLPARFARRRFDDGAAVVVVAKAKAHDLPVGLIAMEVERLERERGELARQGLFLIGGYETVMIAESLGQGARRVNRSA